MAGHGAQLREADRVGGMPSASSIYPNNRQATPSRSIVADRVRCHALSIAKGNRPLVFADDAFFGFNIR